MGPPMKTLNKFDISNKKALLRLDLDVPLAGDRIIDDARLLNTLPTIEFVLKHSASAAIVGHLGRPMLNSKLETRGSKLKMEPIRRWYQEQFPDSKLSVAENLRFEAGEEANDISFAENIVRRFQAQVYIFDAFATGHDRHASIVQIPRLLPTVVGFRFQAEIEHLNLVLTNPKRPLVFIIGGAKLDTKLPLVEKLAETADEILAGGTLPLKLNPKDGKLIVAQLAQDGLDITEESANLFAEKIRRAGTVVWNGPMGAYEKGAARGTEAVAKAMKETEAYTVIGGGDTEAALSRFGGPEGIDWVSSGGGAMLSYLAYKTLPFLEALQD